MEKNQQVKKQEEKKEVKLEQLELPVFTSDTDMEVKLALDNGKNLSIVFAVSF